MSYFWDCPLCDEAGGHFERQTKFALDIATAAHITNHVDAGSLRAVDHARMTCHEMNCAIGKNKVYEGVSGIFAPRLTEYDRKFLNGIKIKID